MTLIWRFIVVFCVVFCVSCPCNGQKDVGDSCTVARSQSSGTCKIVDDCPALIDEIVHKSLLPTSCGFIGNKQIVCCPNPAPVLTRISQKKCADGKLLREKDDFSCDVGSNAFITANDNAVFLGQLPHVARLGFMKNTETIWACGGSLISDEFVLTAAHCVNATKTLGPVHLVSLGNYPVENESTHRIEVGVAERIIHPDFRISSKYNDIALLRLDKKVDFNQFIRPACLTDQFQPSSDSAIGTGWTFHPNDESTNNIFIKSRLQIYSQEKCNDGYANISSNSLKNGIIEESQICAGVENGKTEICQGSGGAPLQIFHPLCMYEVIGIASFGRSCHRNDGGPEVYTRVFHYLDWIEQNVWPRQ